ncbi:MAG: isochorismatase family protein [Polyangiaceae bacterium]|nr:isochorismatase family protein [Polyangiaceae bacterium]NUQ77510.1 isochorismatase family protein [Polyangiaceae bacterium]
MIPRVGKERLLEMVLSGTPDRVLDALAAASPDDTADLAEIREILGALGASARPVAPSPGLRDRILGKKLRPKRPSRPVLLVCDMINDHLTPGRPLEVPRAREIVASLKERLRNARADGIPIIYVCDSHAPGDPDLEQWPSHAVLGTEGAEVWPEIAPEPGDLVIRKRTYSAFTGSELGPTLDRLGADSIVLTGCATEVHLFATAAEALQRGFVVTIPPDSQAGFSELAELVTLGTLSTMVPFEPRYLRTAA